MNLDEKLVGELKNNEHIVQIVSLEELENAYLEKKNIVKTSSNYVSPVKDSLTAAKIIQELGVRSNKVVIKTYAQKQYVIFKGYSGQRNILKGTKYLATNPKVVRMAVGPKGVMKSVKGGFILTAVLSVGIEVFDYFIRDTATLSHLLGTVTGDLIKIGLSTIAAAAAGLAVGASVVLGSVAAAPLIAAIAVGVATGYVLDKIDKKFGATKALIEGYKRMGMNLVSIKAEFNQGMRQIEKNPELIKCIFAPCDFRY